MSVENASVQAAPAPSTAPGGPPLRLQVDLSPLPEALPGGRAGVPWFGGPESRRIIESIVAGNPLMLQIGYPPPGPDRSKLLEDFVRTAAGRGMAVSLVLDADPPAAGPDAFPAGIREAALDLFRLREDEGFMRRRLEGFAPPAGVKRGALLRLSRRTLPHLASFLRAAAAAGVDFIEIPPTALVFVPPGARGAQVLAPGDVHSLAARLRDLNAAALPPDLRIHDVLLDRLISGLPGRPSATGPGFGGCQAAASLAYVAPDGAIFPCIALDFPLGSIRELPEPPPWDSPAARSVREHVAAATPACGGCGAWPVCRGGCPAVRLAATGSWTDDPLCGIMTGSLRGPSNGIGTGR